jgi:CHAD domain-containing protein
MAYQFEPGETVDASFERCAREQLDRAIHELTEGVNSDEVEAVHSARKALKMERSLLRLGRAALPRSARRRQNARLREVARRLSGSRDADVMLEALDDLAERYAGQVPQASFAAIRGELEADRDRSRAALHASGDIDWAVDELQALRGESQRLRARGWSAVEPGLERAYARGRRAMRRAERKPAVENLHEWRKRVKDLWYHARLLRATAPLTLGGVVKEAHALSDLLGDDHDLAVLRRKVTAVSEHLAADTAPVIALIDHRREQLQDEARVAGARLYAESPSRFARRLKRYWKAAAAVQDSGARSSAQELMQ